ncbi:MAG: transposase [Streptosporangiaceae bacterium]
MTGAYLCSGDEAGQSLRPPKARTWARRGCTPVAVVSGKGSGRVSATGLACYRPGSRSRFFYRIRLHTGRKGERRSMSEAGYADLITAAHQQLHAPLILCWDNLNTHLSGVMRTLLQPHQEWLTVIQMPAYAPDLNPVEGAWSNMKNSLGNLGSCGTARQLAAIVKNRLKRIQYRPGLIDGFLAQTGLSLEPEPP